MSYLTKTAIILSVAIVSGCAGSKDVNTASDNKVKLITLEPGHFHAALVQKSMYADVDSTVHVYAPQGNELNSHMALINQYNTDSANPTSWNEVVYSGSDFFEKMLEEKAGNVVVLAGNNLKKTSYIQKSIDAGFNVLSDKPMVIELDGFETLKNTFDAAKSKGLLLYDIMTERNEITSMLQREFALIPEVFGSLEEGSPENPAIIEESTHFFYKQVSGNVLTRPSWFFDTKQQGEGITDVSTHLVDLVQWVGFPEQVIDYTKDIELTSAKRWSTDLSLSQFNGITKLNGFPDFLQNNIIQDSLLQVYANGEINYKLKGVNAKVIVKWLYQAPEGTGDTHYSMVRGTKSNLVIRQEAEQQHKPELYIEPVNGKDAEFKETLFSKLKDVQAKYPGVELTEVEKGWQVSIPQTYKVEHEAHFGQVMEKFLDYMKNDNMPEWEVPNMISKYFTTTNALELSRKSSQ
jgi:predicted dehydrogenase